jgi:surface protein
MFENCSSLTSIYLKNFNTENTMDMRSMFKGCKGLYELDLSSFSTKSINTLNDMFGNINHELKVKVNRDNAERIVDEYEYHEYVKLEF